MLSDSGNRVSALSDATRPLQLQHPLHLQCTQSFCCKHGLPSMFGSRCCLCPCGPPQCAAVAVQAQYSIVDHKAGDQVNHIANAIVGLVSSCHPGCVVRYVDVSHILWRYTRQLSRQTDRQTKSFIYPFVHSITLTVIPIN